MATEQQGNLIDRAEAAAKRMEEANQKAEELLKRNEELAARYVMSGRSEAGNGPVQAPQETPKEYAKRVMSGKI